MAVANTGKDIVQVGEVWADGGDWRPLVEASRLDDINAGTERPETCYRRRTVHSCSWRRAYQRRVRDRRSVQSN